MWHLTQFITWRPIVRSDGHVDKIPTDPDTGHPIDAHDPGNWMTHEAATHAAVGGLGVGFVFTAADPYWFLDLDNCALPDGSGWQPHALEVCSWFPGAAVEVSQSGRGLHVVGCGAVPPERRIKSKCGLVELYTQGRFMALGGREWQGDPNIDQTRGLATLCARYLQPNGTGPTVAAEWTAGPVAEWSGPADDGELVARMLGSRAGASSVFGEGVTVRDLWEADGEALSRRWPDASGREWDYSSADAALAQHLAFWTGRDCERMRRLMLRSELAREKWESRPDYLQRTIITAVSRQTAVYSGGRRESETPAAADTDTADGLRSGFQYLSVSDQIEHFKGCVYVRGVHRIWTPDGDLIKAEQFRATYGGYVFALDTTNDKTTRSAWEAFTESQGYRFPWVKEIDFDPLRPPGEVRDNRVNTYYPRFGKQVEGDISPILRHLELLFPDDRDREIITSYLAACVQLIGHKFQWAPVVQGVPGNGKTVLYWILHYAIGNEYCHIIDPKDITNVFTGWVERKCLACIEELWTQGKYELAEALKTLITNTMVACQPKGVDQRTAVNLVNFIIFSNYLDAVMKSANDRRYAVFYTPQQDVTDLVRDGMDEAYFDRLYGFIKSPAGAAAIAHWLAHYPISIKPFGRAPRTTATDAAIKHSLGPAEQIVLEAVELEQPGFRHDMIDTSAAGELLKLNGRRMSPQAIGRVLTNLGYVRHPGLESSAGKVRVDGRPVRLYALANSEAAALTNKLNIVKLFKKT